MSVDFSILVLLSIIGIVGGFCAYYAGLLMNAIERPVADAYKTKFVVYSNDNQLLFHGDLLTADRINKLTGGSVLRKAPTKFTVFGDAQ